MLKRSRGFFLGLALVVSLCARKINGIMIVDLSQNVTVPLTFAAQTCAGLYNRDGMNVYTIMNGADSDLFSSLYHGSDISYVNHRDFIA